MMYNSRMDEQTRFRVIQRLNPNPTERSSRVISAEKVIDRDFLFCYL